MTTRPTAARHAPARQSTGTRRRDGATTEDYPCSAAPVARTPQPRPRPCHTQRGHQPGAHGLPHPRASPGGTCARPGWRGPCLPAPMYSSSRATSNDVSGAARSTKLCIFCCSSATGCARRLEMCDSQTFPSPPAAAAATTGWLLPTHAWINRAVSRTSPLTGASATATGCSTGTSATGVTPAAATGSATGTSTTVSGGGPSNVSSTGTGTASATTGGGGSGGTLSTTGSVRRAAAPNPRTRPPPPRLNNPGRGGSGAPSWAGAPSPVEGSCASLLSRAPLNPPRRSEGRPALAPPPSLGGGAAGSTGGGGAGASTAICSTVGSSTTAWGGTATGAA